MVSNESHRKRKCRKPNACRLSSFNDEWDNKEIAEKWEKIIKIKNIVAKDLELARAEKTIGNSLDAKVTIYAEGEEYKFLKENEVATIRFYQGQAFQVEAPNFAELEVVETEPGIKGDTASNVTKAATVETGAVVQVPLFINQGDKIKIDTRTGEYLSRV